MTGEKHLKPHLYYSDLYDKGTVEHSRRIESTSKERPLGEPQFDKEGKEIDMTAITKVTTDLMIYFETGERYLRKEEKIREWMDRDKKLDEFFEQAKAPENITCFTCRRLTFVSFTHEETGWEDKPSRVLYMYDCPLNHVPRRAFYDNGEEYRKQEHLCSKCKSYTKEENTRTDKKITTTWTCINCGEVDTYELDLTSEPLKEEVIDENFEADRNRFCLSDKDGEKFREAKRNIESLKVFMDGLEEKEKKKEVYDQVANMKKLKILELEELLLPQLEKAKYVKFHMKDPEMGKDVFVPFVVYDADPNRNDRVSTHDLEKLFKKVLNDTNWRLMSDGVRYRLGMLEGKLRAYEREEDLVKLIEGRKGKKIEPDDSLPKQTIKL